MLLLFNCGPIFFPLSKEPGYKCTLSESFPPTYTTTCRQRYLDMNLVVLDKNGEPKLERFNLPSCCVCYIKNIGSLRQAKLRQPTHSNPLTNDRIVYGNQLS